LLRYTISYYYYT